VNDDIYRVVEERGQYFLVADIAGPFKSNAEAWSWLDANSDGDLAIAKRYDRLRAILAGKDDKHSHRTYRCRR
jgi:hypothetical protein